MFKPYIKPFIFIGFTLVCTAFLVQYCFPSSEVFSPCTPSAKEPATVCRIAKSQDAETVPNIVHFVHLVNPSQPEGGLLTFDFEFRHFIAIYSASHYLKPETIYIHTNVEYDVVQKEMTTATNPYTQAIGKLPGLKFVHCTPPTNTTTGKTIVALPNMSDFVRTDALIKFGGIFLDEDAYVLRDLKPLRSTGFENVIGRQLGGQICPAVLLSTRDNKLMQAYHALQDVIFDGGWATHATNLLTTLAQDFSPADNQVLVLPQDSFFPSSWLKEDLMALYSVHEDVGEPVVNNHPTSDITDFIKNFQLNPPNTWQTDWRLSYTLHGWTSALFGSVTPLSADEIKTIFGPFDGISLDYVLAQNSNFARAVYPAVQHALTNGFLDRIADSPSTQAVLQQQKQLGGEAPGW